MGTSDPNIGVGCKVAGASLFVAGKLFRKFDFRTPDFRVLADLEKGTSSVLRDSLPKRCFLRECLPKRCFLRESLPATRRWLACRLANNPLLLRPAKCAARR